MRLEIKEKGSKAFYQEAVNAASQYRFLLKKPQRKLADNFKLYQRYMILCAVLAALLLVMNIAWGWDALGIAAIVLLLFAVFFSGTMWKNLNKMLQNMMEDDRMSILTMDENGVELDKSGSQTVRMAWGSLAFVRVFDESICFFSKDGLGFVISVDRRYENEVLGYLKNEQPGVTVLR